MARLNVRYSDEIEPQKNDDIATKPTIENKPKKISRFSFVKLLINLLMIASFIGIVYIGYQAFTHKMNPVAGAISFIVSVVVFVCLIKLTNSRRYNWHTPSFAITFWSVVGITLIATFAGIQPLSHYKDELFNKISNVSAATKTGQLQNTTTLTSTPTQIPALSNVAEVEGMGVTTINYYETPAITVELKPINAKANTNYTVDLYEKGTFRQSQNITWNEPQINVKAIQDAYFTLTGDEYSTYLYASNNSNWWKPIFSIKIRETPLMTTTLSPLTTSGLPTITLTYPKGGETWHVGDTVTITWTSTNLPANTPVTIYILSSNGKDNSITGSQGVHNTGSYKWTIPSSVAGNSIIGTHERIDTIITGAQPYSMGNGSASSAYFTITN